VTIQRVTYRNWDEWRWETLRENNGDWDAPTSPGFQRIGTGKMPAGYRGEGKHWFYAWSLFLTQEQMDRWWEEQAVKREFRLKEIMAKLDEKRKK